MEDLNDKITTDPLTAAEWNQPMSEIQTQIESTGITLSGADLEQLSKSIANSISVGNIYNDTSVAANTILLSPLASEKKIERYLDGARFTFFAAITSDSTSVTVNVNGLGEKDLRNAIGGFLLEADIFAGQEVNIRYIQSSDNFRVVGIRTSGNASRRPFLSLILNTVANTTGDGTIVILGESSIIEDTLGAWDVGNFFTATYNGLYSFTGFIRTQGVTVGDFDEIIGGLNFGSFVITPSFFVPGSGNVINPNIEIPLSFVVRMNAGDTVNFILAINGGTKTCGSDAGEVQITYLG